MLQRFRNKASSAESLARRLSVWHLSGRIRLVESSETQPRHVWRRDVSRHHGGSIKTLLKSLEHYGNIVPEGLGGPSVGLHHGDKYEPLWQPMKKSHSVTENGISTSLQWSRKMDIIVINTISLTITDIVIKLNAILAALFLFWRCL